MKGRFSLVREEYLFGEHNLAARRLAKLHEVFAVSSRAFVQGAVSSPPGAVVDLGCGVGHTTEMLRRALRSGVVVGVDSSVPFLERALSKYRLCWFLRGDVAQGVPCRGVDVIYARYVLAHLPEPDALTARWSDALAPGGVLLLEENVGYTTVNAVFREYMDTVAELMAGRGQDLYVGKRLQAMRPPPGMHHRSAVVDVTVDSSVAAEMFAMNFATWRPQAEAVRGAAFLDDLGARLEALQAPGAAAPPLTWHLAQVVLARD